MIEVNELCKSYNDRVAVSGVSFKVVKGEILGFLGPNGAGKSTTMKILSGFIRATSGNVIVNGLNIQSEPLKAKAIIGYLPESPPVYMGMVVEDYLTFAARLHGVHKSKAKAAVRDAMEKCGISDVRARIIGNLSKGYRQRVGLAQAIAHNPPILILDEPTVGLDPRQIIDIRNLIKSLGGEHTVILSTHILPEVQATCGRVVVIDRGKVVATDTLSGIAARMQTDMLVHLTLAKDPAASIAKMNAIAGVVTISAPANTSGQFSLRIECARGADPRAVIAQLCVQENLGLLELQQQKLSLEDAFVKLVSKDLANEITRELSV